MITAVDTNVLLDVFTADPAFGERSAAALRSCMLEGKLIACEIVWAEVCASFPYAAAGEEALRRIGLEFFPSDETSAVQAGSFWRKYRASGGSRNRIIPDFLIGSHAARHADRLLSRDRGFYRKYFSNLKVINPGTP